MKKWLKRIALLILILAVVIAAMFLRNELDTQVLQQYVKNQELSVIKSGWTGNGVDQKGRFINDEFPFLPKMRDLIKWKLGSNIFEDERRNDSFRLTVRDPRPFLQSEEDGILWMGHATFYIRLNGVGILTDPVFETPTFFTRFVDVPSQLGHIRKVDYVLLSHDHRDHMDEASLRAIAQKFPDAAFLAGLRSEDVLDEWKTPGNPVITSGWFQELPTIRDGIFDNNPRIYFHPVRHWSQRFALDVNWRLWGGFVIETTKATIYFGGDSGYGRHYKEAGELHPKMEYFLIGIGAYEPRWIMEPNHNNPSDTLKAFRDAGAATLVPMHYGTFDLSDEPPGAPLRNLLKTADNEGLRDRIRPLDINESIILK